MKNRLILILLLALLTMEAAAQGMSFAHDPIIREYKKR
jgi:hypothetical protein